MSLGVVPNIWKHFKCLYFQGHAVFMDCLTPKTKALHSLQMSELHNQQQSVIVQKSCVFMFEIPFKTSLLTDQQSAAHPLHKTDINIISKHILHCALLHKVWCKLLFWRWRHDVFLKCCYETYQTTRCHNLYDYSMNLHCHGNPKSHLSKVLCTNHSIVKSAYRKFPK
jgi:hypothetical protein